MPRRRENRGGRREGTPGKAYAKRTDMQAPKALPGGEYGSGVAQIEAQRAAPLPARPSPGASATTPPPGMAGPDLQALIAGLPGLADPSQRPGEPLTAGLPSGPGAGPSALAAGTQRRDGVGYLRAMIAEDPDPELFALLAEAERVRGGIVPRAMMPPPETPAPSPGALGNNVGVRAGYIGAPTGTRTGRISAREGMA